MSQTSAEALGAVMQTKSGNERRGMDIELLSATVRHHGNALLERMVAEQVDLGGAYVHLSELVDSHKATAPSERKYVADWLDGICWLSLYSVLQV